MLFYGFVLDDYFLYVGAVAAPDAAPSGNIGLEVGGIGEKDIVPVRNLIVITVPEFESFGGNVGEFYVDRVVRA